MWKVIDQFQYCTYGSRANVVSAVYSRRRRRVQFGQRKRGVSDHLSLSDALETGRVVEMKRNTLYSVSPPSRIELTSR